MALLLTGLLACNTTALAQQPATAMAHDKTAAVPSPPAWLAELDALYDRALRVEGLERRDFQPEHWWSVAAPLIDARHGFQSAEIGKSAEGRPLRHVSWGKGQHKVLMWSQMHGDESTATMSLADLFHFLGAYPKHPLIKRIRGAIALHAMPLVNPDGAARFQRRNAQGIDVNRDARALASPEAQALKRLRDQLEPEFGFNLHDQRVGYRAGESDNGVAIALLAPPFNDARDVNATRGRAIELAAAMRVALEPYVSGHMGRWSDDYNALAFGDGMQRWGTSTVLMESGGIEGDTQKQTLRKLNFLALVAALDAIATNSYSKLPHALYTGLPENGKVWPDILVRGGTLATPGVAPARADMLVSFRNPLTGEGGRIMEIGDLAEARARNVVDATGLYLVPVAASTGRDAGRLFPEAEARFHLSRDREGRDVVWTLDRNIDPKNPPPG